MSHIAIVDTCVFLNVLDVPGFNQDRHDIILELETFITEGRSNLLLPFIAIIEAGNHIAQLADGGARRLHGQTFVAQVQAALSGDAPWTPTRLVDLSSWAGWLETYPDCAMRGLGLGDLSIVKEWEAACERHPLYRVHIWTIDHHLKGYDRPAHRWIEE